MSWSEVIGVLLGAILAILTTFISQVYNEWRGDRIKRIQLKRFLTSELANCVSRIESLLNFYGESETLDPNLLVALERTAKLFEKYREAAYLLNVDLSRKVLEFYDSLDRSIELIQSMLRLAQNPIHEKYSLGEIDKQLGELERTLVLGKALKENFNPRNNRLPTLLRRDKQ